VSYPVPVVPQWQQPLLPTLTNYVPVGKKEAYHSRRSFREKISRPIDERFAWVNAYFVCVEDEIAA
jgi:hypothetical protein